MSYWIRELSIIVVFLRVCFHFTNITDSIITAFEEHLYESALYAVSQQRARLHFTIAEEHLTLFQHKFNNVEKEISQKQLWSFQFNILFKNNVQIPLL